jgi:hypothetical protein
MAIGVHFTVNEPRGDLEPLERRLKNQVREKYPVFRGHLMAARGYAENGSLGDAHHVYLRPDGVYCALGNRRFKGSIKPSKVS